MLEPLFNEYLREAQTLASSATTTEPSYYPAIRDLLAGLLKKLRLPFGLRVSTSERRSGGGTDLPDLAFYDGSGDFVVCLCEVKLPGAELDEISVSTERNDQIGRYLAQTSIVIVSNVRGFGLVSIAPNSEAGSRIPAESRRLEETVELWSSESAMRRGSPIPKETMRRLAELIETAVTRFAPIAEPESLARILASQARRAKADLPEKFGDAVQVLLDDFGKALGITFVGEDGEEFFRSSLVQTAYYSLFAGWALWYGAGETKPFRWDDLTEYLKIPFLGGLFHEFQHPRRLKELNLRRHLDIATETLRRVNAKLFFQKFQLPELRRKTAKRGSEATTTAIMYFYEPFLEAFDPELRKELGVWYTPPEIVQYQVRKIDQLLRTELGCERGYADEQVVVLDPCCGTGAYLIEVLRCLADQLESEGVGADFAERLLDAIHRRVLGFEILTAPFVIAQLQLYLILSEMGVAPKESDRPAIFLTNALTGWDGPEQLKLNFPELQDEYDSARAIKHKAKIIVILGNPPYNRFASAPIQEESELVDAYKGIRRDKNGKQVAKSDIYTVWGVRKHLLNDLYIRFFRLAEKRIGIKAEHGVVSFISNSSYLNGRSHPIMRQSLLSNFDRIWIDNLHGNRLASERTPWGDSCETIFNMRHGGPGIKVGTCISTLLKGGWSHRSSETAQVEVRDFWGNAEQKRAALLSSLEPKSAQPPLTDFPREGPAPYSEVSPSMETKWKLVSIESVGGFEEWPSLDELFLEYYQGINPNRGLEGSVIDCEKSAVSERMKDYYSELSDAKLEDRYPILMTPRARYDPTAMRGRLKKISQFQARHIVPYVVFPYDVRWLYYEPEEKLLNEKRPALWENLQGNEFFITVPQPRRESEGRPLFASSLFDLHLHDRGSVGFPITYLPDVVDDLFGEKANRKPLANLNPKVWLAAKSIWGLEGDLDGSAAKEFTRKLFRFALALTHSPQYGEDHKESIAQDWAHLPIPRENSLLEAGINAGSILALLLNPLSDAHKTVREVLGEEFKSLGATQRSDGKPLRKEDLLVTYSYYGAAKGKWVARDPREGEAMRPEWGTMTGDLFINDSVCFGHVPERVWRYELGGYPVLKKWLGYRDEKRRDGKPLQFPAEVDAFRGIVQRIASILALGKELDYVYQRAIANALTISDLGIDR